jgi:hypothetical protein
VRVSIYFDIIKHGGAKAVKRIDQSSFLSAFGVITITQEIGITRQFGTEPILESQAGTACSRTKLHHRFSHGDF